MGNIRIPGSFHLMKREYEKALSLTPENPDMQAGRGFALNYLGKPQEAIVLFRFVQRYGNSRAQEGVAAQGRTT